VAYIAGVLSVLARTTAAGWRPVSKLREDRCTDSAPERCILGRIDEEPNQADTSFAVVHLRGAVDAGRLTQT
jgi:hypothetical protein